MRYDTVFFDLDGTLLDTLDDLTAAVNHVMALFGYPLHSRAAVRRFVGNGVRVLLTRAVPGGEENPHFAACEAAYRAYYESHTTVFTKPYPGIPALLEELAKRGVRLAIVSNKQDAAVQSLRIAYFPTVCAASGERPGIRRKPNPDLLFALMEKMGATPEQCCLVGDSEVDVETAARAGIGHVAVTWGFRDREELTSAGAKVLCDTPAEVLSYLMG